MAIAEDSQVRSGVWTFRMYLTWLSQVPLHPNHPGELDGSRFFALHRLRSSAFSLAE